MYLQSQRGIPMGNPPQKSTPQKNVGMSMGEKSPRIPGEGMVYLIFVKRSCVKTSNHTDDVGLCAHQCKLGDWYCGSDD